MRGVVDQLLLERFDPLAELLQDDKVMVDDGVEQGVGQVVGPQLADAAFVAADAVPDRVEHVARLLLEGDDEVAADDQAELVGVDLALGPVVLQHPDDEVEHVAQVLQLGPLGGRQDVLQDQRVEAEMAADLLDDRRIVDAVDVDPGDRGGVAEGEALLEEAASFSRKFSPS